MRLFVGIPLAADAVAELAAVMARLRPAAGDLRLAAPGSWHITLQFLGNASPQQYECLAVRLAAVRSPTVPIRLAGLGCLERAGVFHAGVELAPELAALAERVAEATAWCGFAREERPFRPHITLARAKGHGRSPALRALAARITPAPEFSRFLAEEFLLYESFPDPGGSRYEIRARFPLRTATQ